MLEIRLQRQQNLLLKQERDQKIREMAEAQEARWSRFPARPAPQTVASDVDIREIKEQISKLSQVDTSNKVTSCIRHFKGMESLSVYISHVHLTHARGMKEVMGRRGPFLSFHPVVLHVFPR